MKTYKVWVEIEECNDRTDEYRNLDFNRGGIRDFRRLSDAEEFANSMQDIGELSRLYTDKFSVGFVSRLYQVAQMMSSCLRFKLAKGQKEEVVS